MKRAGLFLLAVVLVLGMAACGGGGSSDPDPVMVNVTIQVYDSNANYGLDDSFTVSVDDVVWGQTPYLAAGGTFTKELEAGTHVLRIAYTGTTDNDGVGTYGVTMIAGATFQDGTTVKNEEIRGIGLYHQYFIVTI